MGRAGTPSFIILSGGEDCVPFVAGFGVFPGTIFDAASEPFT